MSYVVGVDIGGSKIAAGLVKGNRIIKKKIIRTPRTRKALLKGILDVIDEIGGKRAKGIGIGVAGLVDEKGNWIRSHNIPCVKNIPLKNIVQKRFRKKVEINNDANCFALEEALIGEGKKSRSVFGLILGTGTGGGIVIDKKLCNGADYLAGEVGMIRHNGKSMEELCSARFVTNTARKYFRRRMNSRDAAELALKGSKRAKKIYNMLGENIGYLISIIVCILNPDVVVIGGGLSNAYPLFRSSMLRSMKKGLFYKSVTTAVKRTRQKDYGILGAAALLLK